MAVKVEVLADAIMLTKGYFDPASELYQLRNPGGLRPFLPNHASFHGFRAFPKAVNGYQALIHDLERKVSGSNRAGLDDKAQLLDLLRVFEFKDEEMDAIFAFLTIALGGQVTKFTPLAYFRE